jgi:hypothetical protein
VDIWAAAMIFLELETGVFPVYGDVYGQREKIDFLMKKRKLDLKPMAKDIYNRGIVRVSKEENEYFFEIGKELTSDVAEAVTILMRKVDFNESIWDLEVSNIILENITPERSLFWLTLPPRLSFVLLF